MKPYDFLNIIIPLCKKYSDASCISVTSAQSIEESGWGTSLLFTKANASFGIKATPSWKGKVYSNCKVYSSYKEATSTGKAIFRAYNALEESFKDHNDFLKANRYLPVRNGKDYKEKCKQLRLCGYCPEVGYDTRLIKIIESYKLYQYDEKIDFPFKVRVIYKGNDGINVRKKPNYDESTIDKINGPIYYGSEVTVVAIDGDFYRTKSGLYITSNSSYIERV